MTLPVIISDLTTAEEWMDLAEVLEEMGPLAKPAIPHLAIALTSTSNPFVRFCISNTATKIDVEEATKFGIFPTSPLAATNNATR